jgi:two-component system response regulator AtoC
VRALIDHPWPGNVRELQNVLERALVSTDGMELSEEQLRPMLALPILRDTPPPGDEDLSVKRRTEALERTLISRALERTRGNRTRAAALLDLSHRALLYKIREYGLTS